MSKDYRSLIQDRISILSNITNNTDPDDNQYAEYVYEVIEDDDDQTDSTSSRFKTIYLIDRFRSLIFRSGGDDEVAELLRSFETIWDSISATKKYIRITDGQPLNILDAATVWLGVGMRLKVTAPFAKFGTTMDANEREEEINRIIDDFIVPALASELTTDMVFTRINIISIATNLSSFEKRGIETQRKTLTALMKLDTDISELEPQQAYDDEFTYASFLLELRDTNNSQSIIYTKGLEEDIFDAIKVSPVIPICIANLDEFKVGKGVFQSVEKRWFKILSSSGDDLNKYQPDSWPKNATSLTVIIYVYIGENVKDAQYAPQKDFVPIIYSFKKGIDGFNKFTVTLYAENIELLMNRLNDHLVGFQTSIPTKIVDQMTTLRQEFIMSEVDIDKDIFLMLVSTNTTAATLLRFAEKEKLWTQKKNLSFDLYLLGNINIQIKSKIIDTSTKLVKKNGMDISLFEKDKVLVITLTTQNLDQYNLTRFFILRFFTKYVNDYKKLLAMYNKFLFTNVPEKFKSMKPEERKLEERKLEEKGLVVVNNIIIKKHLEPTIKIDENARAFDNSATNIKKLRQVDPALWGSANYTRPVAPQIDLQVMPIYESEIEKYKAEGRDVIRWPVNIIGLGAEWQTAPTIDPVTNKPLRNFYTTTRKSKPHITLVKNPGPNKKTHPMIPKCQESTSDMRVNKDWTIVLNDKEKPKSKDQLKTLKILDVGRVGPICGSLLRYMQTEKLNRMGVQRSQSSFLHCVAFANGLDSNDSEDFRSLYNKPEADDIIIKIRQKLSNYATACMQENPELTLQEIEQELADPTVFLDPSKHYRAVEELYGVNIFTAVPDSNKELIIEAPSYQDFYVRSKRRELYGCIVVLKLMPQQSKLNRNIQCEVLFTTESSSIEAVFNNDVTDKFETAVNMLTKHILVRPASEIVQVEKGFKASQSVSVEMSTEQRCFISTELLSLIEAQHIDSIGKLRAIMIKLKNNSKVWCLTPPLEPLSGLNVGDFDANETPIYKEESFPLGEIESTSFVNIQNELLHPNGIIKIVAFTPQGENLVGIWIKISEIHMFIPLVPSPWKENVYKPVRFDLIYSGVETESATQELSRLQKVLMMFVQIAKRLYSLSDITAEQFMTKYAVVAKPQQQMSIAGSKRSIPITIMKDFDELLNHFSTHFSRLFVGKKLLCDSQRFYDNILRRLKRYESNIADELALTKNEFDPEGNTERLTAFKPFLDYYYVTVEDFTVHNRRQIIFMSHARYNLELKSQLESKPLIVKKITPALIGRRAPYFFMYDKNGLQAMFLVQNMVDGSASRAATNAKYWFQNKVNYGYFTPALLGTDNIIELEAQNFTIRDPNAPMIIIYQTGEAASLLSLNQTD